MMMFAPLSMSLKRRFVKSVKAFAFRLTHARRRASGRLLCP